MSTVLTSYILALLLLVGIDMIWLLGPGRPLYVAEMGGLLRANPDIPAALAFYMLYAAGLIYFAVHGAVTAANPAMGLLQGAILGLVAYGTYDLTGLAVINGFTLKIAAIDMLWGSALSGIVSWAVTKACLWLG